MDQADRATAALASLAELTKDQLIEAHRAGFGTVGDTARTSKAQYLEKLGLLGIDELEGAIMAARAAKPAGVTPAMMGAAVESIPAEAAQQLLGIIKSIASVGVDEERVRSIVADAVAKIQPRTDTIILKGDAPAVTLTEHTHPAFPEVLAAVNAGLNVLLVGPAGCGKTHLAGQVAKALGRDYGTLHCTAGASESQLTGWLLPVGDHGRFDYVASQFVALYEQGNSLFLLDEIDAADPNMLLVINAALANGHLHIPQRFTAPTAPRGTNAAIMAAANTFLTGADLMYAGRNQLDAATGDRFYIVPMDYDAGLEATLAGRPYVPAAAWTPAPAPTTSEIADLGEWVSTLRRKALDAKLRRVVSTRTLQKGIAARNAGIPMETVKQRLLAGWTRDELAKVQA